MAGFVLAATLASSQVGEPRSWHGSGAAHWNAIQGIVPRSYTCPRVNPAKPVRIESGDVRDDAWEHVPWTEPFVDIEGTRKPMPRHETRMKMMWDDDALWVGAWMDEPQVVATLSERNSVVFQDNDFEVFLDPRRLEPQLLRVRGAFPCA